MNERQRLTEEQLEDELRSLPELDPPAHLVSRVMEHVLAAEVGRASEPAAGPAGTGARRIPVWQPAAAAVAFAAVIVFISIRYTGTSIGLLRNVALFATNAVHVISDMLVGAIAGGWALFAKMAVTTSVLGTVVRTVAAAIVGEFGLVITVAVAVGILLQISFIAIAGRRSQMS